MLMERYHFYKRFLLLEEWIGRPEIRDPGEIPGDPGLRPTWTATNAVKKSPGTTILSISEGTFDEHRSAKIVEIPGGCKLATNDHKVYDY